MTDVGFYHLQKWPLERALPRLLEKVLARGLRAVVRTGTEARLEHLDDLLWTYDEAAFLPHGTSADGHAGRQPVWLTLADEAPNGATVLVLVDGVDPGDLSRFDRVVAMFDGHSAEAVQTAREHWRACRDAGHTLTYWQQTDQGGWQRLA